MSVSLPFHAHILTRFFVLASLLAPACLAQGIDQGANMAPPELKLVYSAGKLNVGSQLLVHVTLDPAWHINSDKPAEEFLLPTKLESSAKGITFGTPIYPAPYKEYVAALEMENLVFKDTFTVIVPIAQVAEGYDSLTTSALLSYQACSNSICLSPAKASGSMANGPVSENGSLLQSREPPSNPWRLLLFAFLGGLLLNLMPCVLPILPLKAFGLVRQAHESRARLWLLSLSTVAGVLVSFLALAAVIVLVRQAGESVGWGFQFQSPAFLAGLSVVMALFALNLFGLFEIALPGSAANGISAASRQEGPWGAFSYGLLLTLLSTPCSAPFLGSAMGFAFTQSTATLFLFFTVAGIGLALPYILLPIFPGLLRKLPKPGAWMLRLKQFLGFLLLATLVFLIYVLGESAGNDAVTSLLAILVMVSLLLWLQGAFGGPTAPAWRGWLLWALMVGWLTFSWNTLLQPSFSPETPRATLSGPDAEGWYHWSPEAMADWQGQGKTVFVDFTADWCITCKANEKAVLSREHFREKIAELGAIAAKADWTDKDPAIGKELARFGRAGVPFYVVYPGESGRLPIPLSELLTMEMVLDGLDQAGPSKP